MRIHPYFTSAWIFIAYLTSPAFAMDDMGIGEDTRLGCGVAEKSATYRQVLAMTDKDVDSQCGLETGAELELCRSVLNHMRANAKASQEASQASCTQLASSPRPLPRPDWSQSEAFSDSALKTKEAQNSNLKQVKIQDQSLEEMKQYRDQMNRSSDSLISERQTLQGVDTQTKLKTSVISADDYTPPARAPRLPEPSYDDYQVGRPINSPKGPPPVINASTNGSRNLAEYEQKLSQRIQQQRRLMKLMDDFEEETKAKKVYHENTALELGKQAATLLLQAKQLGVASEELASPLAPGPQAAGSEKMPKEAAAATVTKTAAKSVGAKASLPGADFAPAPKTGLALAAANPAETSEESAVLDSFQSRLLEDGKGKLSGLERSRLKELLRRRAHGGGASAGDIEKVTPGELVAELLADATKEESRAPASEVGKANERRGIVRLDVDGAVAEIESQLEELDRSMGILNKESESLFDRVKTVHRRSEKSGVVGASKS